MDKEKKSCIGKFFGAKICRNSEMGEVVEKWGGGCGKEDLEKRWA